MDLTSEAPDLGTPLVVAVSGGPDSVALLHLLVEAGFSAITVAHVDHGFREESAEEAEFVRDLATDLGLEFEIKRLDGAPSSENLEAWAREQRYGFFRSLEGLIVTAHHADDQVETVLMNIIRGCGLDGLSGMREREGDLWRPLLRMSKQEILSLCDERAWPYVKDSSNDDLRLRRNALRHEIIPRLKELNPNLLETMAGNVTLWQQAADALRSRAEEYLLDQERRYDLPRFLELNDFEQQVVLREIYDQAHGTKKDLYPEHLQQVLKVLRTNASGKQKEFGPGKILLRQREWFEVRDLDA